MSVIHHKDELDIMIEPFLMMINNPMAEDVNYIEYLIKINHTVYNNDYDILTLTIDINHNTIRQWSDSIRRALLYKISEYIGYMEENMEYNHFIIVFRINIGQIYEQYDIKDMFYILFEYITPTEININMSPSVDHSILTLFNLFGNPWSNQCVIEEYLSTKCLKTIEIYTNDTRTTDLFNVFFNMFRIRYIVNINPTSEDYHILQK